ncbi:hypothetical protein BOC58_09235 [Burkholderia pseudomallei]|nr:hypothetical protein BOC57_21115 [Burkholderia pseudomallei]ARL94482.1 hypothetical protein BOC58_09235 [Burkholderia pseudomallei]
MMMRWLIALFIACSTLPAAAQCVDRTTVVPADRLQSMRTDLVDAARAGDPIRVLAYIFDADAAGIDMLRHLVAASRRGVSIRLLIDGIGPGPHLPFTPELIAALHDVAPALEVRIFHPKENLSKLGRRMHDKLFLVGNSAVIGSSSTWNPSVQGALAELDLLVEGDTHRDDSVLSAMRAHFDQFWQDPASVTQEPYQTFPSDSNYRVSAGFRHLDPATIERWRARIDAPTPGSWIANTTGGGRAAAFRGDCATLHYVHDNPSKSANGTLGDILTHLTAARHEIVIVNPYVILVPELRALLEIKRQRDGVRVIVVTAAIEHLAAELPAIGRAYVNDLPALARAGIEVREYRNPQRQMLHAKLIRIDSGERYVGSFNFDPLSARSNTENGVWIQTPDDSFDRILNSYIAQSTPVIDEHGRLRVNVEEHCINAGCAGIWRWLTPLLRRWL